MIIRRLLHDRLIRDALRASFLASLLVAWPAAAATIAVTTLQDELSADGDCSLREALQAANTNAAVDACVAGTAGLDVVILPAGTIPLSVAVNITDAVTIRGAGRASTTIQRGATTAFNGTGVAGATLTLEDVAVIGEINTGGTQDIAITRVDFTGATGTLVNSLNGAITITDTTMTGGVNSLGGNIAIANSTLGDGVNSSGGALSITDSTIANGGINTSTGAINMTRVTVTADGINSSSGAINMTRVTITGANGNGVNNSSGTISLVESSVVNSQGDAVRGGTGAVTLVRSLVSGSAGWGVASSSGPITVTNSTISGNEVGINASSAVVAINGSTIAMNEEEGLDGGVASSFALVNSIVAGNAPDCGVAVASGQFSLTSDASCGLAGPGNRPSTNPLLGPLANNGGPTLTHMPQAGSPVIDAGSNALCQAVDQRGVTRPIDGNGDATATCDMGAVEAGAGAPPPPPPPPAQSEPIPMLSEWALIALIGIIALASARSLRRGRNTR